MIHGRSSHSGVVVGVDTHKDEHVAVALDQLGARLGERRVATTIEGYADLERWANNLGKVRAFGIEGTGSYGAGLARFLTGCGYRMVEVNRPQRSERRRLGKSDPIDAELAARAVLAGVAQGTPKSGVEQVEILRMLKSTKNSALKVRTQAMNQIKAMVVTAPAELRQALRGLTVSQLVVRCASLRPGALVTPTAAAKYALRSLARRYRQLTREIEGLEAEIDRITSETAPTLVGTFGIGPDIAATLLVTAGSNPERLRSEAAFAALCGVSPIPASSGKTNRHRLNRGGDRQANAALHRVVVVRLRHDQRTKAYMQRRTGEGMSKAEVIRCLKPYVAREVFPILHELGQNNVAKAI
jgi:transposase